MCTVGLKSHSIGIYTIKTRSIEMNIRRIVSFIFVIIGKHQNLPLFFSARVHRRRNSRNPLEWYCSVNEQKPIIIQIGPYFYAPQGFKDSMLFFWKNSDSLNNFLFDSCWQMLEI